MKCFKPILILCMALAVLTQNVYATQHVTETDLEKATPHQPPRASSLPETNPTLSKIRPYVPYIASGIAVAAALYGFWPEQSTFLENRITNTALALTDGKADGLSTSLITNPGAYPKEFIEELKKKFNINLYLLNAVSIPGDNPRKNLGFWIEQCLGVGETLTSAKHVCAALTEILGEGWLTSATNAALFQTYAPPLIATAAIGLSVYVGYKGLKWYWERKPKTK